MIYTKRILWLLIITSAATLFAQSPATPKKAEVCTEEDYAIFTAALNDRFVKQKPDKVVLRDDTSEGRSLLMSPMAEAPLGPDVSQDAKEDFDSRNQSHAKIEAEKIKAPFEVVLLSAEEFRQQLANGGGYDITFVSLPGLNAVHNRALLSVGTSYGVAEEGGVVILLEKDDSGWKVLRELFSSHDID
jgi:hypothetical protein